MRVFRPTLPFPATWMPDHAYTSEIPVQNGQQKANKLSAATHSKKLEGKVALVRRLEAEFCTAPATAVAQFPASLDRNKAATLPISALTAGQGLFERSKLDAGEGVLIHGGAGGAVELAERQIAGLLLEEAPFGRYRFDFISSGLTLFGHVMLTSSFRHMSAIWF